VLVLSAAFESEAQAEKIAIAKESRITLKTFSIAFPFLICLVQP